jgi:hypothetical protein
MSRMFRRLVPVMTLCLATLLGGCVVYDGGYRHGWGWHDHGWHEGWHR